MATRRSPRQTPQVVAKQAEALSLLRAGHNFDQIAKVLKYRDRSGARKAVMAALSRSVMEDAEEVRQLELSRLDELTKSLWDTATAPLVYENEVVDDVSGKTLLARLTKQHEAIDRLLKIAERRAKYLGLEAPQKLEVESVSMDEFESDLKAYLLGRHDQFRESQAEAEA